MLGSRGCTKNPLLLISSLKLIRGYRVNTSLGILNDQI